MFLSRKPLLFSLAVILVFALTSFVNSQSADSTKGDALLKKMSEKLAASKSISFSTTEMHDLVKSDGKKIQRNVSRDVLIQRPDKFWTEYTGDTDWKIWYDGKFLTGVSDGKKIFIQRSMPSTLDQCMDELAEKLNMNLPISDIVYSSPYEAFMSGKPSGGYVGQEQVDGTQCNHLSYKAEAADWELWINTADDLPCKLLITYKEENSNPVHRINFKKWNLAADIDKNAFTFKIPDGYERIPILERVRLTEENKSPQTQTNPSKN